MDASSRIDQHITMKIYLKPFEKKLLLNELLEYMLNE